MRNATHGFWYLNPVCPVSAAVWGAAYGALLEEVHQWGLTWGLLAWPHYRFPLCFMLMAEDVVSQLSVSGSAALPPCHYGLSP